MTDLAWLQLVQLISTARPFEVEELFILLLQRVEDLKTLTQRPIKPEEPHHHE